METEISESRSPSGPGRPTDERKTQAILDAARACFFEDGFAATSIERIASRAGVSKVTVYNRFSGKSGILEAMVRRQAETMQQAIGLANRDAPDLQAKLANFGRTLLGFLFGETYAHLDRIIAEEGANHREMTRRFFEAGPATMRRTLADILREARTAKGAPLDDPLQAAEDLLALWRGFREVELRFYVIQPGDTSIVDRAVSHGIDIFVRAYGIETASD